MSPAIVMLPSFLRDLERFRASATGDGIVLRNGHSARAFNLSHHDRQKLVDAVCSLSEAIQAWAKTEPTPEPQVVIPAVQEGPYGPIHQPPADIVMGTFAAKQETKPDIVLDSGLKVEVKKRPYNKRKKHD